MYIVQLRGCYAGCIERKNHAVLYAGTDQKQAPEPLGMLNITLGYGLKMGTDIGVRLVKKAA
jgi:hypothetical protein